MSQFINPDDQQLSLDFSAPETNEKRNEIGQSEVVNLNVYAQSRQLTVQTQSQSVQERLLLEAQKLWW